MLGNAEAAGISNHSAQRVVFRNRRVDKVNVVSLATIHVHDFAASDPMRSILVDRGEQFVRPEFPGFLAQRPASENRDIVRTYVAH